MFCTLVVLVDLFQSLSKARSLAPFIKNSKLISVLLHKDNCLA